MFEIPHPCLPGLAGHAFAYAAEQPEAEGCLKQSKPRREESKMPGIIS